MLQSIRDRAQSWVAFAIVGLIVLALSAVAFESLFAPDPIVGSATVDGEKITQRDFQRAYQLQRNRLQSMLGDTDISQLIPDEQEYKLGILRQLIDEEVIWQMSVDAGYRIDDDTLARTLRSFQSFQSDGGFDRDLYNRLLRQNGWSPSAYELVVRRDEIIQQYRSAVLSTSWVSPRETAWLLAKQEQTRDFGYVDIPTSHFMDKVSVTDSEVVEYYNANKDLFMTTEQLSVDYLELSLDLIKQSVSVEDETLRKLYEERKLDFSTAEERKTAHILIEVGADVDETAAKKIADDVVLRLDQGESFGVLAKELSDDIGSSNTGGDLGFLAKDSMLDTAYADAAYKLVVGSYSKPIRSDYGYHIIKLLEVKGGDVKSFDDVRSVLEEEFVTHRAEEIFYDDGELLANLTFENPDMLELAAQELGLTVQTSSLFTRDAGLGIAIESKVRDAAYSDDVLIGDNNSELIELSDDRVVVLRVKKYYESALKTLADVEDSIVSVLKTEQAERLAVEAGESLMNELKSTENIADLVKSKGWNWVELNDVKRRGGAVNLDLNSQVFKAVKPVDGELAWFGFSRDSGDYSVVALSKVSDANVEEMDKTQQESVVQRLDRMLSREEYTSAIDQLRSQVSINEFPENL